MTLLHRHTAALAKIDPLRSRMQSNGRKTHCMVCGAFRMHGERKVVTVIDHEPDCEWVEAVQAVKELET